MQVKIKWDYICFQLEWNEQLVVSGVLQHPDTIYDKPCTQLHHSEGKQNIKELARAKSRVIPHQREPTALMQLNSRAVL
jgi:hypothetical protein